jgi:hypothetical protein
MPAIDRFRLIFHGAVVLFVGLLCGYPTVVEAFQGSARDWHTAHEALIMMGIWILAMSSVHPVLVLPRREAVGLFWSLLAIGYGFMLALIIQGVTGVPAFEPGHTLASVIAFTGSATGILGALLATMLTMQGARAAMKSGRQE